MRALQIDFARPPRGPRVAATPLLAIAVIAGASLLGWRMELQSEVHDMEPRLARAEGGRDAVRAAPVDRTVEQEVRLANDMIEQLSLPWDRLFRAIEGAATSEVNLLGIAPDVRTGNVQIRAEATDAESMFAYVRSLAEQRDLANILLVEHHTENGKDARPLKFTASASWMRSPS